MRHCERLIRNSQALRKNATEEERKLWYTFLKTLPARFHRQYVIGDYIVDFYCPSAKLVIELDGTQHYLPDGVAYDTTRNAALQAMGLCVVHYSNADINFRFEAVCQDIYNRLFPKLST